MATITINCATAGLVQATTTRSLAYNKVQEAEIFFTPTGTYDQAASESIELTNPDSAIENSRRNGKAATVIDVIGGQSAYDAAGNKHYHVKGAIVSSNILELTIFEVGGSELADGAIPTLNQPLSVKVIFTEA